MKTKKILYLFLLPLIFTACETKDIPVYTSDDAALYFQRTASYIWGSTTVTYSTAPNSLLPEQLPKKTMSPIRPKYVRWEMSPTTTALLKWKSIKK